MADGLKIHRSLAMRGAGVPTEKLQQGAADMLTEAFPEIAGSAASLLLFCQFVLASTAALIVGMTFDGSQWPMAMTIAATTLLTFVAFRVLVRPR